MTLIYCEEKYWSIQKQILFWRGFHLLLLLSFLFLLIFLIYIRDVFFSIKYFFFFILFVAGICFGIIKVFLQVFQMNSPLYIFSDSIRLPWRGLPPLSFFELSLPFKKIKKIEIGIYSNSYKKHTIIVTLKNRQQYIVKESMIKNPKKMATLLKYHVRTVFYNNPYSFFVKDNQVILLSMYDDVQITKNDIINYSKDSIWINHHNKKYNILKKNCVYPYMFIQIKKIFNIQ